MLPGEVLAGLGLDCGDCELLTGVAVELSVHHGNGSFQAVRPVRLQGVGKEPELRHLRYLLAVGEHANFTRAAEELHIAQPTLSQQIRQLEKALGVQLLDRTGRRTALSRCWARGSLTARGKSSLRIRTPPCGRRTSLESQARSPIPARRRVCRSGW
ncbi:hypothetical protein C4B68_17350 [Streptomyces dengpaensis]|uniref:HTH lysR-type domain-containing protein n=1 Tax=Streptomyces dengpaensis TaxID=2049881 RepID=A0ABN5IDF8_9ACTN|nr:hypothetical protein C4B68_17350 [Streptomyces dengpaensis]